MLQTPISAAHKSYSFNSIQGVSPAYQDLMEPMAKPVIVGIPYPAPLAAPVSEAPETPEQRNTLLAKNIAQHRQTLKSMLAEIPLSTLWLLNIYGQNCYKEDDNDDSTEPSDQHAALSACYQNAESAALKYGLESARYLQSKYLLSEAFRTFTLTAEQLKNLATTITHAYVLRAIENPQRTQTDQDIQQALAKKMQKLANVDLDKLQHELHHLGLRHTANPGLSAFLLPPDNQLHTSLRHLIRTEELWLGARQKLATANTRLVLFMANQYKGGFLDFNDLAQEGQSGLLKAVDRFDHQRGFKFSTYAVYWIRQGISRALSRSERVVRLPFGQIAHIGKVHRLREAHFAKTGQEISVKALAEQANLPEADINNILLIGQGAVSLDTPIGDEENPASMSDFMEQQIYEPPLQTIATQELILMINTALSELSEKEAMVICCRFGIHAQSEMTLEEIGQTLNLTRERVRQIQSTALKKLRAQHGADLASFL